MRVLLDVNGMSQYNDAIRPDFRNSACGPTTAHVILNYLSQNHTVGKKDINELYGEFQAGADAESKGPLTDFTFDDAEPSIVANR